jgi:hypothetical protein
LLEPLAKQSSRLQPRFASLVVEVRIEDAQRAMTLAII